MLAACSFIAKVITRSARSEHGQCSDPLRVRTTIAVIAACSCMAARAGIYINVVLRTCRCTVCTYIHTVCSVARLTDAVHHMQKFNDDCMSGRECALA